MVLSVRVYGAGVVLRFGMLWLVYVTPKAAGKNRFRPILFLRDELCSSCGSFSLPERQAKCRMGKIAAQTVGLAGLPTVASKRFETARRTQRCEHLGRHFKRM